MSTNLAFAPQVLIAETVGIAVLDTVIISSSCLIPNPKRAMYSASVPLLTATPYFKLFSLINRFSNFCSSFPKTRVQS